VTEDREQTSEQTSGADREQTSSDVEAHSTIGQAGSGQSISQTDDDDESDVEAHTMIGQTSSQTNPQTNP
jgi:general stress protein YciG